MSDLAGLLFGILSKLSTKTALAIIGLLVGGGTVYYAIEGSSRAGKPSRIAVSYGYQAAPEIDTVNRIVCFVNGLPFSFPDGALMLDGTNVSRTEVPFPSMPASEGGYNVSCEATLSSQGMSIAAKSLGPVHIPSFALPHARTIDLYRVQSLPKGHRLTQRMIVLTFQIRLAAESPDR